MPKSWVWVKIENIVNYIQRGKSPTYSPIRKYPVLAQKCNQWSGITLENVLFFAPETFEKYTEERFLQIGDIVINSTGTGTLGRIGLFDTNVLNGYECIVADSHITVVRCNQSMLPKYVYYFLCSEYQQKTIEENAAGSTNQKELYINTIKEFFIPIPPPQEQRRIVKKIEECFVLINQIEENKLSLSQFIKQTKSKVLDLAIHGKLVPQNPNDEPVSVLLERIKKEHKPKKLTTDISHYPFEIPENWMWVKIKDVVTYVQRGKSPKYSPIKKYPVLAQKCNQWTGITLENALFFEPETFEKYTKDRFLQTGDIVINSTGTGTLGRIGLFDANILGAYEYIVADSHITVVRCNQQLLIPKYVYRFLCSGHQQKRIEDNAAGSTNQKELYIDAIKEFYISLPPLAEQKRIVEKIENIFQTLDSIQNNL